MKMIKNDYDRKQEINTETCLKKTKTERENMGKTDTIICQKKNNRGSKNIQKIIVWSKRLNIIMNKTVFNYDLIVICLTINK